MEDEMGWGFKASTGRDNTVDDRTWNKVLKADAKAMQNGRHSAQEKGRQAQMSANQKNARRS